MSAGDSERALVLAPRGRDAKIARRILEGAGVEALACSDAAHLCREIEAGAGVALLTTEALDRPAVQRLGAALGGQPSWSHLPVIVFAAPGLERLIRSLEPIDARAQLTILDRPVRVKTLISATRSALSTRRRQYQLRDLMQELTGRVHERDKFLAILGHELRNPLAAILLASQARDPQTGGLEEAHAALIERQSRHLTRLVDDLLDLSRVTTGKIVLQRQAVDLKQVVVQSLATVNDAASSHRIEIRLSLPASPVLVDGDPIRLEQIALNLLTNAVKYTPAGGRADLSVKTDGRMAVFQVTDTGVGIAKDRLDSIFGLFTQADNAIGRSQGGMGIGLSLVRSLVELHGGTAAAESEGVNQGSTFTVRLPLARASQPPAATSPPAAPNGKVARAGLRVVVVDDNADVRMMLEMRLARMGHEVDGVADGEDAVIRIVDAAPDMALVDLGLPGIDGYEVATRVRAAMGRDIYLVALSGFGQPEDKRRAIEVGFDEHVTKPADARALQEALARARLHRGSRAG